MKLHGIDFGHVWDASGSRGFFGEGYWYQKVYGAFGIKPKRTGTFISKTGTIAPNAGNMPLKEDGITPRQLKPACIKVYWGSLASLNAVGLSNPGIPFLLERGLWQERDAPFMISFMPIQNRQAERYMEMHEFVGLVSRHLSTDSWKSDFGIQLNLRCPNKQVSEANLVDEAIEMLSIVSALNRPVVLKFDSTLDVESALRLSHEKYCDAISISNAVRWNDIPLEVREAQFGSTESPLEQLGGGAVSGTPILPLTIDWLERAKKTRFGCPLAVGGGIMTPNDAEQVIRLHPQVQAIELGTVRIHRPWRYDAIYDHAYNVFTRSGRRSLRPPDEPFHAVPV